MRAGFYLSVCNIDGLSSNSLKVTTILKEAGKLRQLLFTMGDIAASVDPAHWNNRGKRNLAC